MTFGIITIFLTGLVAIIVIIPDHRIPGDKKGIKGLSRKGRILLALLSLIATTSIAQVVSDSLEDREHREELLEEIRGDVKSSEFVPTIDELLRKIDDLHRFIAELLRKIDDLHRFIAVHLKELERVRVPARDSSLSAVEAGQALVFVAAAVDSFTIQEIRFLRHLDPAISQAVRDRLLSGDTEIGIPSYVEPVDSLSNDSLAFYRRAKSAADSADTVDRATVLPEERLVTLDPPSMTFYLHAMHFDGDVPRWEMIVKNLASQHTKTFSGAGALPDSLEWGWQYDNGDLIEPGLHGYYVAWTDGAGHQHTSNMSLLAVSKHLRTVTITITPNGEKLPGGAK